MRILVAALLLLLAAPSYAWQQNAIENATAEEKAATEARLEALAKELERREAAIQQRAKQLSITENELRQLELQMSAVAGELNTTRDAIAATEARLATLQQQQTELEQQQAQQLALLAKQLDAAYRIGEHDYLKLVLNQEDPAKFERLLGYYGYFNRARLEQVAELRKTQNQLEGVKADIVTEQQILENQAREQRQQQGVLQSQQKEQQNIAAKLAREQSADQQRISQLRKDQEALEQVLAAIIAAMRDEPRLDGLASLKGKLAWPADGKVQRLFGVARSGGVTWKGVIINGTEGEPVRAIADGRVLFANWLRGFGLVIVLDHGDGYLSLYGHNQTIIPQVGELVRQGSTIALVGQSGGRSEPGVYFEIRVKGDAVNPTQWMR